MTFFLSFEGLIFRGIEFDLLVRVHIYPGWRNPSLVSWPHMQSYFSSNVFAVALNRVVIAVVEYADLERLLRHNWLG